MSDFYGPLHPYIRKEHLTHFGCYELPIDPGFKVDFKKFKEEVKKMQDKSKKFIENQTVYLKGQIVKDDGSDIPFRIKLLNGEIYWTNSNDLYTKEEMLKELNKPEIPRVGETWEGPSYKVKILLVTYNQLVVDYLDESIGIFSIEQFLKYGYKKIAGADE